MVTPNTKLSSVENSGIGSIEKLPGHNRGTYCRGNEASNKCT